MVNYQHTRENGAPIYHWTNGVDVEEQAMQQLKNVAALPFIHHHVAAMPDMHWGMGATVGSVIATKGAIVPAAVGVDLGCGMMAVRTNIHADRLPDNLSAIRSAIEARIPHGRTNNGGTGDRGAWNDDTRVLAYFEPLASGYERIVDKHPKARGYNCSNHMGTLGTGNHFVEVCLDESNDVWVMLHSGSRGPGNRIGSYFIELAKKEMERYFIGDYLPDKDLSYFVEHTELFDDYVEAVDWAQAFALANRVAMMDAAIEALRGFFPDIKTGEMAVNCHHNYVARENHYGANVFVTRKGAVRAREGDLGIIPGSMGARSFIVRGKGEKSSFCSCSHGAGRKMSRGEAKRKISLEDHIAATSGVECRKDADVIDESPAAYKDIDAVMAAQSDLVDIVHTLRQVVNVKG